MGTRKRFKRNHGSSLFDRRNLLAIAVVQVKGECGQRDFGYDSSAAAYSSGYIVGGYDVKRGSFPWQVSIQSWGHFCGGTIINKRSTSNFTFLTRLMDPAARRMT